ncbi:MAG TPA: hypothetical protein VKZ59_07360 [Acidobacteriota bacterium]|nr:hypothetical protein [Acidobacteriota bacterium]
MTRFASSNCQRRGKGLTLFPNSFKALLLLAIILSTSVLYGQSNRRQSVQYLTFTVEGAHGIYVRDLKKDEVELRLDGEPVEIRYFGGHTVDTAYAFLIENSPRTAPHAVSNPRWGMVNAVDQIRYHLMSDFFYPLSTIGPSMLAEFFLELKVLQDFTREDYLLVNAVSDMRPEFTGVAVDRIEVGRMLGRGVDFLRERPEKRKMLVLFTATIDRESYAHLEEYKQMLQGTDVELFVVSFALRFPSGPGVSFNEQMNTYFFRQLTGVTSGKTYISTEYAYLDRLFTDLRSRLENSYTIGFYLPASEEPDEHDVELKINRSKVRVTCRPVLIY